VARGQFGIGIRPDKTEAAENIDPGEQLRRRRWRILLLVLPSEQWSNPLPRWVRSQSDFIAWICCRLSIEELRAYFDDCEQIAKQTSDLELLRFARSCSLRRSNKWASFQSGKSPINGPCG
jgi:hypothetical protein